ncbi:hypothetical protein [Leifsonia sp. Le1]|uniref:hypothetical protein n=1 Tax=Leifsonia sp. Le1 TaxID=3404918 RepID=UPI003EBD5554
MRTISRTLLATAIAVALLPTAVIPTSPARAEEPAAQLSVTLTNSEKTVTTGDKVTYTGHVKNLGAAEAAVTIALEAPGYLELGATTGATVDKNTATWTPTIAPGADNSFTISATIGKIPSTERRVTAVASVYVGDGKKPVVRTADASFIQGVKDTPHQKPARAAATRSAPTVLPWIIGGGILLVIIAAAAIVLTVRNRTRPRRGTQN